MFGAAFQYAEYFPETLGTRFFVNVYFTDAVGTTRRETVADGLTKRESESLCKKINKLFPLLQTKPADHKKG